MAEIKIKENYPDVEVIAWDSLQLVYLMLHGLRISWI